MKMEYVELGEVCEIKNGYAFKSTEFKEVGIPLLRISNFDNGQVYLHENTVYLDEKYLHEKSDFIVEKGDILIALSGATTGKFGIYTENFQSLLNQRIGLFKSGKSNNLENKYFYFYLSVLKKQILRNAGGAAQPNISTKAISKFKIPLPPLEEQKRIAALLDEADRLCQLDKALIEKYDALTQSLFLDMFGDPVINPKGWEKVELGSLGKISSGSTPSRKIAANFKGEIPWVKTGEVNGEIIFDTEEHISTEGLKNSSCKLNPINSLIIAMYGQGKTRGQVGILGIESTTNQACAVIPPSLKMNHTFLFIQLKFCYHDLRNLSRGGNQSNLNIGLIKKYTCILPPLSLQNEFAERVAIIEQQKQQAQEALQKSEDLFNGLLQDVFRG